MSVPILLALSAMSTIAVFAISAAAAVSPSIEEISAAENDVTFSMYSFADMPAVLYASDAYPLTTSAFSLNSVSIPPRLCWSFAPSFTLSPINLPMAAPTPTAVAPASRDLPKDLPADVPALSVLPASSLAIVSCDPFIFGMILTVAVATSYAIFTHLPLSDPLAHLRNICQRRLAHLLSPGLFRPWSFIWLWRFRPLVRDYRPQQCVRCRKLVIYVRQNYVSFQSHRPVRKFGVYLPKQCGIWSCIRQK